MRSNSLCHGGVGEGKTSHMSRVELFDFDSSYPGSCSSRVSSPTYHVPTSCSFLALGPAHCSCRPRHATTAFASSRRYFPLAETAVLPTPDSSHGMWQQTDPLVSPLEAQAPGRVSSVEAAGFVGKHTLKLNRIGSRDHVQYRWHDQKREPEHHPPSVLSNDLQALSPGKLLPSSIYHQGRRTLSPRNLPALQTSPPDPPQKAL